MRPKGYLKEPKNLIYDFQLRAKEGKELNPFAIEKQDQPLYGAICKQFDSFDDFLEEAGFEPEKIRKHQKWTLEKIKKELDKIYDSEIEINYHNSNRNHSKKQYKIFRMLIYFFGSIKEGLKHFNYTAENKFLEKLCPKCKKVIMGRGSVSIICKDCRERE